MYIVFPIWCNRLQWCNGYLACLPRWRPRFDSQGRKYFFVFNVIFSIFYIFCNKNLVAFYIKVLTSHFFFFFFFYKFSNPNRIITVMVTDMRLCHFFKFAFCQICVAIIWSQSFQHTHSKSLLILKAGYMYSAVFCAVMHGILLYIFS